VIPKGGQPDGLRQEIRRDSRKRQEELSTNLATHLADLLASPLGCLEDAQRMREKERTSGGENRSASGPLEESISNLRFELLDLLAERGWATRHSSAARLKVPVRATATK
jgi:hypothetical protein